MTHKHAPQTREIFDILEAEYRALLAGEFDEIAELLPRKERLIESLASLRHELSAAELTAIKRASARNDTLYTASLEGIRAARLRLSEIVHAGSGLKTYSADGKSDVARLAASKTERRA